MLSSIAFNKTIFPKIDFLVVSVGALSLFRRKGGFYTLK